jgi:toxin YhaV
VNDEDTKRAYESDDDAYATFRKMLKSGNPPNDWADLMAQSRQQANRFHASAEMMVPAEITLTEPPRR